MAWWQMPLEATMSVFHDIIGSWKHRISAMEHVLKFYWKHRIISQSRKVKSANIGVLKVGQQFVCNINKFALISKQTVTNPRTTSWGGRNARKVNIQSWRKNSGSSTYLTCHSTFWTRFRKLGQRCKKHPLTFELAKTAWMAFIAPRSKSIRISKRNLPLVKFDMAIIKLL